MLKDNVFQDAQWPAYTFKFNKEVATVFDDIVVRSVPFYEEMQ